MSATLFAAEITEDWLAAISPDQTRVGEFRINQSEYGYTTLYVRRWHGQWWLAFSRLDSVPANGDAPAYTIHRPGYPLCLIEDQEHCVGLLRELRAIPEAA